MKLTVSVRAFASLVVIMCLLAAPVAVLAKKGEKNYKRGLEHENAQQWERAAQEFALAVAASPSDIEYQLHYRRAIFNASQRFMEQGRTLAEQGDFTGAYNAFRQAMGYDPVNELAASEMARMLRLQREKEGLSKNGNGNGNGGTPGPNRMNGTPGTGATTTGAVAIVPTAYTSYTTAAGQSAGQDPATAGLPPTRSEQLRVINYNGDLEGFVRKLGEELNVNVLFDRDFPKGRTVNVNLKDVTTARALDHIFLTQNLFFQKLDRRTILVADQSKRGQYQQLVLRTFYLSNTDPDKARSLIQSSLPPTAGRQPQVTPHKETNSITVRDTPENIRLIGQLLQSIDKDRAEVVMDVNIYEVSRTNLLQLGNQIGTDASLGNLGGLLPTNFLYGARTDRFGTTTGGDGGKGGTGGTVGNLVTNALGGSFLLPASTISAFQAKDNTRLLASTQVHAFDSEQSTTRIGQKVPVQTAQVSPFGSFQGNQTNPQAGATTGLFGGSGFPVIQYQDTGLILKFTPQVFPNLDVQVKMEIESNDVIGGASNLTPTFSQRNVSGTARIPNNRTMMIASVAQDRHSDGRRGLPLLGLIPVLGRLFSTPTRNDSNSDIVITMTPRVLRAPTVEPGDIDQRPSGTLQTPVSESLEAMVVQADREDQLAAARRLPTDVSLQVNVAPGTETADTQQSYVPAPKVLAAATDAPAANNNVLNAAGATQANGASGKLSEVAGALPAPTATTTAAVTLMPVSNFAATVSAASNTAATTTPNAPSLPSIGKSAPTTGAAPIAATPVNSGAQLYLLSGQKEMRVGEKQRLMLLVKTSTPLGLAAATLRFDPRVMAVRGVAPGSLFGEAKEAIPSITPSIDARGSLLALIAPALSAPITGMGVLLFIEVEALAAGESDVTLDQTGIHLMSVSGQNVATQLAHTRLTVKQ